MKTLRDLLQHEIQDLYSAETQFIEAVPSLAESITSHDMKSLVDDILQESKDQRERLVEVSKILEVNPEKETCKAMAGLIREAKDMTAMEAEDEVKDAGMIAEFQRIAHYQIAGYGSACTYAEMTGEKQVLNHLKKTLNEEKEADERLKKLAKAQINEEAMA
ncbi:YciE/YciF ferroxidase family protein [Halocola ammonii]